MDVSQLAGVEMLLNADDITICCQGLTMLVAKSLMQRYLDEFHSFCNTWGFVVNVQKTVFQYLTTKRVKVPVLRYHYQAITYRRQHKLLGMMLDAPHL
jgi:hypothetical protein